MIATIVVNAEKKKFSDHMETTLQRSQRQRSLDRTFYISAIVVAAIAGEWFHMIAMIAAIAEVFFFSAIAAITAMVAIIWKRDFKRKDCLPRNFYLNCVSL